ncbi:MAG: hypothetical protein OEQ39_00065 [Gammaproteobacteria bacterium]|nr:hypothetical protein [Gammaproteobacteria bacterium]
MKTETDNFQQAAGGGTIDPRYSVGIEFDPDRTTNLEVNKLLFSEQFDNAAWVQGGTPVILANTVTAPIGATVTADSIEDNDSLAFEYVAQVVSGINPALGHNASVFIQKDAIARTTRFVTIHFRFTGSTEELNRLHIDTSTGEFGYSFASSGFMCDVQDFSAGWWRVWIRARSTDQLNTNCELRIFPAGGADAGFVTSATAVGSAVFWGAQISETFTLQDYVQTTTVAVSAELAQPDVLWLCSHADCLVPLDTPLTQIITGSVVKLSGQTQRINPDRAQHTIGNITITAEDINSQITTYFQNKLEVEEIGLRKKKIRLYKGYRELLYWDDYQLEFTYLIDSTSYKDGAYKIITSDIQRTTKEDILDPHVGVLTSTINASATEIPVTIPAASGKFPLLEHDAVYGSNPSTTIGYVQIDKEIIAHAGWDAGFTFLNVVERGALGTKAAEHVVTATETDKKKKVEEYIYLEMAAPRMIYALLTGVIDGQAGGMPSHWHLGIDTSLVTLTDFQNIGEDLWDTTLNTGRVARFLGLEKIEGKAFIESELLLWLGAFMPVYSTGAYGLKRMNSVLPYAAYDDYLNASSIISYGDLIYDQTKVINNIAIKWNWIQSLDRFTKITQLIDSGSIAKYGSASKKTYEFKGVFTGVHTDTDIAQYFNQIRDRYGAPPMRLSLKVMPKYTRLEVGDTIRINNPSIIDVRTGLGVDRTFEVEQVRTNWIDGTVTLELFGGTEPAGQDVISGSFVMQDTFYTTQAVADGGTDLSTVLTIVGGAVTTNGTITGTDTRKIYYYDGDLTINAGVTVTITKSVELRIKGTLLVNGTIDGVGQGLTGGAGGSGNTTPGYWGALGQPGVLGFYGRSLNIFANDSGVRQGNILGRWPAPTQPTQRPPNSWNIRNPDGLSILGLVGNIQGTSGSGGAAVMSSNAPVPPNRHIFRAQGGAGGASGAGLVAIVRGMAFGPSGEVDVSGANGLVGNSAGLNGATFYASSGVGGSAGAVLVLIDGNASTPDSTKFIANRGNSNRPSANVYIDQNFPTAFSAFSFSAGVTYAAVPWFDNQDQQREHIAIRYIPESLAPFENLPAEEEQATTGYGNKPPEWEEIVDSAGTIPQNNATVGAQAGVNLLNGSSQVIGDTEVLNSNQTPEDIAPGTLIGVELITSAAGQRIRISTAGDELEFYGDRGDTTIAQVATIGIKIVGPDTVIGLFGDVAAGNSNVGVYGATYNGTAGIFGASGIRNGVYGVSNSVGNTYSGVYGTGADSAGVRGVSTNRYGVWGSTSALVDTFERTAGVVGSLGSGGANNDAYGGWFRAFEAGRVPLLIEPDVSTNTPPIDAVAPNGSVWVSNDETQMMIKRISDGLTRWRGIGALNTTGQLDIEKGVYYPVDAGGASGTRNLDFALHNHFYINSLTGAVTFDLINILNVGTVHFGYIVLEDPGDATSITWLRNGLGGVRITWLPSEPVWGLGTYVIAVFNDGQTGDVKLWRIGVESAGGGNVSASGTPAGNQIAIWTDSTTIKGDAAFTFNSTLDLLTVGDGALSQPEISVSGPASTSIGKYTWRVNGVEAAIARFRASTSTLELEVTDRIINWSSTGTQIPDGKRLAFGDTSDVVHSFTDVGGYVINVQQGLIKFQDGGTGNTDRFVFNIDTGALQMDGNLDMSGYLDGYAGVPTDGEVLTWVTATGRAEFLPGGGSTSGTVTATITTGGGTVTLQAANDTLHWYRIFDMVFVYGLLIVNTVSTPTGFFRINGLPVSSDNGPEGDAYMIPVMINNAGLGFTRTPIGRILPSDSYIQIFDGPWTGVTQTADHFAAGTQIYFSGWYRASA